MLPRRMFEVGLSGEELASGRHFRHVFLWLNQEHRSRHDDVPIRTFKILPFRFYAMTEIPNLKGSGPLCASRRSALIAKDGRSILSIFEGG